MNKKDKKEEVKKEKEKGKGTEVKNGKKKVELKIKINLWKILIAFTLFIFFAPFLLSVFEIANTSQKLDISQALTDIKDEKVKEIVVQDAKLVLTYQDSTIKTTTISSRDSSPRCAMPASRRSSSMRARRTCRA